MNIFLREITKNKVHTHTDFQIELASQARQKQSVQTIFANNGTTDVEETPKNAVKSIEILDKDETAIAYSGNFDKEKAIQAEEIVIYKAKLDETHPDTVEDELKRVKFCFWLKDEDKKTIPIETTNKVIIIAGGIGDSASTDEKESFFEMTGSQTLTKNLEKAYFYTEITTTKTEAILKIKFSKWLDRSMIMVEAFFTKIKRNHGNTTASRYVKAFPEIIDAYWTNANKQKVFEAGYSQDVFLYFHSLGLKDTKVEFAVFEHNYALTGEDNFEMDWSGNKIDIEENKILLNFKLEIETYQNYIQARKLNNFYYASSGLSDSYLAELDILQLFFQTTYDADINPKNKKDDYGRYLRLHSDEKIFDTYFARKETTTITKPGDPSEEKIDVYKKLGRACMGEKVYLVAQCLNLECKEVTFNVYEKKATLVENEDTKLPLVFGGAENQTEITATVENGFAIAEIDLMHCKEYDHNEDWEKILSPAGGKDIYNRLYIKTKCKGDALQHEKIFLKSKEEGSFELVGPIIFYYIYHYGKIEMYDCARPKKAKYFFQASDNKVHEIGTATVHLTRRHIKKGKLVKDKKDLIPLAYVKDIPSYSKGNVKFKFLVWNSNKSKRWYINPSCFAGLLGAMIDQNAEDVAFNGFSTKDGGPGDSTSHINGEKGDLRYFSTNFNGEQMELQYSTLDYNRQVKFNKALYKFFWGRTEKMYSENFNRTVQKQALNPKTKKMETKSVIEKTLLPYCKHMKSTTGTSRYRHHHHIHLSGFDHSKVIKK